LVEKRLVIDEDLAQPWAKDKEIRKATPSFTLTGTETGGKSFTTKEDSGKFVVRNVTDGVDELVIDPTSKATLYRALASLWVKRASPTPGVGGAYGTAVALKPGAMRGVVPLSASLTWGGTFGTGETVTIRLTAKFSDGTSANITRSATATGTVLLNNADLQGLFKDGVYITEIDVDSSSSASSTSVTTSATIYGIEI